MQSFEKQDFERYERAKKNVKALKGFYSHVWIFVIVTVMIFVVRYYLLPKMGILSEDQGFIDWLDINTFIVPGIWAVVIVFHGVAVHKFGNQWLKNWEQRKVQEFLEEDDEAFGPTNSIN